jgi:hypothetical protein
VGRQTSLRHKKLAEKTLITIGFGYPETQQSKLDSIRFGKILQVSLSGKAGYVTTFIDSF